MLLENKYFHCKFQIDSPQAFLHLFLCIMDQADPSYSPPPSPFHGFGDETVLPGRLEIVTEGQGDDQHVLAVKKLKLGRLGEAGQGAQVERRAHQVEMMSAT